MRSFVILILLTVIITPSYNQTFYGAGGLIPDDGNYVVFPITVSGLSPALLDTSFGLESVCIDASHTWIDDLTFVLISPDGTQILLAEHNGGDNDYYTQTCFDDVSTVSINVGSPPFSGSFRPEEDLGYINNGQNGNGIWYLFVIDTYPFADAGQLNSWSLTFGAHPASVTPFVSSDLPIVLINTSGQMIPDDPKILVEFDLIDNGNGQRNYVTDVPWYNGYARIETRGSSSQMFPKKSYGLETCNSAETEVNVGWLGMPAEHDWILNANYSDKTMMRNALTYFLWNRMGHYGSRCAFCEVVINGKYQGVYVMMEKIKRDNNRVNVAKLTGNDNSGDALTGGYIFKIDKTTGSGGDGWTSNYLPTQHSGGQTITFLYEYPKSDTITTQQKNYIQQYTDSFETALWGPDFMDPVNGFRKYADESTFIDYLIINELSKNIDGYRLSTFLYKDKDSRGGKLKMGPVWDYDLAWRNANYYGGDNYTGWAYKFNASGDPWQVPFWWQQFQYDTLFVSRLKCRWEALRQDLLSQSALFQYIDSITALINEAKDRNFDTWQILGTYVWPNPSPIPTTYTGEIQNLKTWITNRLNWIDNNLPGICNQSFISSKTSPFGVVAFPNPVSESLYVEVFNIEGYNKTVTIKDLSGRTMYESNGNTCRYVIDMQNLKPGIYSLNVETEGTVFSQKIVKVL